MWEADANHRARPRDRCLRDAKSKHAAAKYRDYLGLAFSALELVTNSALARTVQSRCFSFQRVRRTTRRLQVHEDAHARSDAALIARREFVRYEAGRGRHTDARSKAVPGAERIGVSALHFCHREHLDAVFMRVQIPG